MAPTPRPGTTVQVLLPVPGEQQATNFAINSGKLIAAVILVGLSIWFLKWMFGSVQMRVISAVIITLFIAYMMWGKH